MSKNKQVQMSFDFDSSGYAHIEGCPKVLSLEEFRRSQGLPPVKKDAVSDEIIEKRMKAAISHYLYEEPKEM